MRLLKLTGYFDEGEIRFFGEHFSKGFTVQL